MRRTLICLLSCLMMYGLYMYTLPAADPAAETANTSAQPRVSARITIPAVRLYAVSLGRFDTQTEGLPYAAAYSARGAAGCLVETENGWELLGAGYPTSAEADSACAGIKANESIPANVVLFSADSAQVSVSATQSQTSALTRALELLESVPAEIAGLSRMIDSGTCDPETARSLAAARYTEISGELEKLSAELGATADIFCRMTETGLYELCESLRVICAEGAPSGLQLSSLMKQCSIETTLYMVNMLHTLS